MLSFGIPMWSSSPGTWGSLSHHAWNSSWNISCPGAPKHCFKEMPNIICPTGRKAGSRHKLTETALKIGIYWNYSKCSQSLLSGWFAAGWQVLCLWWVMLTCAQQVTKLDFITPIVRVGVTCLIWEGVKSKCFWLRTVGRGINRLKALPTIWKMKTEDVAPDPRMMPIVTRPFVRLQTLKPTTPHRPHS